MTRKQHCFEALAHRHLFLSSLHYSRFVELYDYVEELPFFCDSLIKTVFIAAWIQDFHDMFLEDVRAALDSNSSDTSCLERRFEKRLPSLSPGEKVVFEMALEFLRHPGETPSDNFLLRLSHIWVPIADNALEASQIIDHLDDYEEEP